MSNTFHRLTTKDLRRIAYQSAENNKFPYRFNKEKQAAGWDWMYWFLQRHPDLRVQEPETTSLNRVKGFCNGEVDRFFTNLGKVFNENFIPPTRLNSMDETCLPTVKKLLKVIDKKGQKRLSMRQCYG